MSSILTVLIPGLSQALAGNQRRAGTIFLAALLTGAVTGGVGWVVCGLYSLVDARSAAPAAAAPAGKGAASVAPWLFKFAVLGVGAFIAFHAINQGGALQSLTFLGIDLRFQSSMGAAGGGEGTAPAVVPASGGAGGAVPVNALREVAAEISKVAAPPDPVLDLSGTWRSPTGSSYRISVSGTDVRIVETSYLLFVPFESASCQGTTNGPTIQAQCALYTTQTSGMMTLSLAGDGSLVGTYVDQVTGGQAALVLYR